MKNEHFVTYNELENYGAEVANILSKKGEKAILILSQENTDAMFRRYADFFEEKQFELGMGLALKEDVSVNDLEEVFRGYLALSVLMAFIDEQSISQLGVCA